MEVENYMSTKQKAEDPKKILPDIKNIKSQETYTLPSKGLVYEENENIPASITLRRMTTKEDKMRMRNETEDKIRRDILQACIMNEGVDAGRLKLADANFLLFRLRSISLLNDIYKVQVTCPFCNTVFIHEIELSKVPIEYFSESKKTDMSIVLPYSNIKMNLKYPSLSNMINMGEKLREYFDQFPNVDKTEAIYTTSAMLYIKNINDQILTNEELEDLIDSLDILDNRAFRKKLQEIDALYGIRTDIEGQCPECKNIVKHGLPITSELFYPSL